MASQLNERPSSDVPSVLPGYATVDDFTQAGFRAVMEATRFSNQLPTGHNWDMYSSYPSFQGIMDSEGNRVLELISMILRHQGVGANIARRDLEEKFDMIVDANDTILERVGCNLDELAGIRRNPEPVLVEAVSAPRAVSGSWNRNKQTPENVTCNITPQQTVRLLTAKNIQRPQIKFKDKIDNSLSPFMPRIKEKPNSKKPLAILIEVTDIGESFSHPYEFELDHIKVPENQLKTVSPRMYLPLSDTPLVIIEQAEDIQILMSDLKNYAEIAVDLEHHSYRTFQGITCLMQISTRDTDYIIDTLELRDKLHCLNEIFTDPKVVKVFHGSDHDIEWLQRDLCLYVVNMFDTHQAARQLKFAHLSLAYLLKHYCNIAVNKHFQLADWRIRPLPEELITYAREDTHYLLYIYDKLKNALLEAGNNKSNILMSVLQRSTELCKKRYEKPILKDDSHMELYRRNKKLFDNRQLYAFRELYRWRDKTARQEDESLGYVLPNHMLLQISELLPREMQGILACCNPIPPLVRQNLASLHKVVLKAREQSLVRPLIEDEIRTRPAAQTWVKINLDSPLHCPHDLTRRQDFREDLPTLINSKSMPEENNILTKLECKQPHVTVFELPLQYEADDNSDIPGKKRQVMFVSPYERYKLVRPFLQAEEQDENGSADNTPDQDDNEARIRRIKDHFMKMSMKIENQPENGSLTALETSDSQSFQQIQVSGKRKRCEDSPSPSNGEVETGRTKQPKMEDNQAVPSKMDQREIQSCPQNNDRCTEVIDECPKSSNIAQKRKLPDTLTKQIKVEQASSSEHKVQKKQGKKHKRNQKKAKTDFQPYDYSKADFTQFQGGSTVSSDNNPVHGKFRPKGRKSKFIGKTNHKSFTYGKGRR